MRAEKQITFEGYNVWIFASKNSIENANAKISSFSDKQSVRKIFGYKNNVKKDVSVAPDESRFFFENCDYQFVISKTDGIGVVEDSSYPRWDDQSESEFNLVNGQWFGTRNFGNHIGVAALLLTENTRIEFDVLSTKLDDASLNAILEAIDKECPFWIWKLDSPTQQTPESATRSPSDLEWLMKFYYSLKEFIDAIGRIVNRPHQRLQPVIQFLRADQIATVTLALEEQISEHRSDEERLYAVRSRILQIDTPENRFCKYALSEVCEKLNSICARIPGTARIQSFGLEVINTELRELLNHSFWKSIGDFHGLRSESLVLQRKVGYSSLYRIWIDLQTGFQKMNSGNARISMKSIDEIYEIWCLVRILHSFDSLDARNKDRKLRLNSGQFNSSWPVSRFEMKIGVKECTLCYKVNYKSTFDQIPDFSLEFKDSQGRDTVVIFDAKYKIEGEDPKTGAALKKDSLGQMHRYRDAIRGERIGVDWRESDMRTAKVDYAVILFPGTSDDWVNHDQYIAINKRGVGALPCHPDDVEMELLKQVIIEALNK